MEKRKFTITVVNTSTFEIEAEDRDEALSLAEKLLCEGDETVMEQIEANSLGWTETDAEVS